MEPFVEIQIISTTEEDISHKNMLRSIKQRFEDMANVTGIWKGDEGCPILRLEYPSEEAFTEDYLGDLAKIDMILFLIAKWKLYLHTKESEKEFISRTLTPDGKARPLYLVLKYSTNWKQPMKQNYRITARVSKFLDIQLQIEELVDGFIFLFRRKNDFEDFNVDKTDINDIGALFERKGIDMTHPSIQEFILKTLKKTE